MTNLISASMLYNLVQCPKRVALDLFGDPSIRDEVSPFVQLLWEQGAAYEQKVMASGAQVALDLSGCEGEEKERLTLKAMERGEPLIYGGRIDQRNQSALRLTVADDVSFGSCQGTMTGQLLHVP